MVIKFHLIFLYIIIIFLKNSSPLFTHVHVDDIYILDMKHVKYILMHNAMRQN
jgi:hypothetical protein